MPYPMSPFSDNFNTEILTTTGGDSSGSKVLGNLNVAATLKWLCSSPKISSYRINTLLYDVDVVMKMIKDKLCLLSSKQNYSTPEIYKHPGFHDTIIVHNFVTNQLDLAKIEKEIVVDVQCAAAVLRGAHIFAPGVIGMTSGIKRSDEVSIYADIAKMCKKGYQKIYEVDNKVFIGNGIVKMPRCELFGENLQPSGVAIEVTNVISGCPTLGEEFLPLGSAMLQNLPSIVCVNVLNPIPGETVLDMCASPGNKTTHIAALMKNQGILIAIDKTPTKVKQLSDTCDKFKATVLTFQADSTKILDINKINADLKLGPPFAIETFDKILLDAPCSALGKRPQFLNKDTEKVIRSFVPLQRKLFLNAVKLLKVNGTLVYSTCTITVGENEGIVAWALRTFNCLKLVPAEPFMGSSGWDVGILTAEELKYVQRFGPGDNVDSVGFFVVKFIKIKKVDE